MSLEQWLEPVSIEHPCGPNLEYDPAFLALEEALRVQPSQEFRRADGDVIEVEGGEIKWPQVREQAQALLARSKDLRVAVHLTRALLRTEGYGGIARGLELIRRLLEAYWEDLHPALDEDDHDPTMRLNALVSLNAFDAVLGDLRASSLSNSRQQGALTVRDIEIAQGRLSVSGGDAQFTPAQVDGLIAAAVKQMPELAQQARDALIHLNAIICLLADKVGPAQVPDFSRLQAMIDVLARSIAPTPPADDGPIGIVAESRADSGSVLELSQESHAAHIPGQINGRKDVLEILNGLCQYLDRIEPGSPVPILLRRAQRMMSMNFLELMQELAPDGLMQAEKVLGAKLSQDDA